MPCFCGDEGPPATANSLIYGLLESVSCKVKNNLLMDIILNLSRVDSNWSEEKRTEILCKICKNLDKEDIESTNYIPNSSYNYNLLDWYIDHLKNDILFNWNENFSKELQGEEIRDYIKELSRIGILVEEVNKKESIVKTSKIFHKKIYKEYPY